MLEIKNSNRDKQCPWQARQSTDTAKKRIHELEDRPIEIAQTKPQRDERMKKKMTSKSFGTISNGLAHE